MQDGAMQSNVVQAPGANGSEHSGVVAELEAAAASQHGEVIEIPIGKIDKNPFQTRTWEPEKEFAELAESIRTHGVIHPIVVRPGTEPGRYTLITGERRWKASKQAGKATVPGIVRHVAEQVAAEMTIIENLQRQDITCMDQAHAFLRMSMTFEMTQDDIGKRVGMSREAVANYMRLTRLPKEVQHLLLTRQLDFSKARVLMRLPDEPKVLIGVAQHAVRRDLSVTQLDRLVDRAYQLKEGKIKGKARFVDPNVRAVERELERTVGLKVKVRDRGGKGSIEIMYGSVDDFERVVKQLRKK
jgi:ParB family chromosome partitioning protein